MFGEKSPELLDAQVHTEREILIDSFTAYEFPKNNRGLSAKNSGQKNYYQIEIFRLIGENFENDTARIVYHKIKDYFMSLTKKKTKVSFEEAALVWKELYLEDLRKNLKNPLTNPGAKVKTQLKEFVSEPRNKIKIISVLSLFILYGFCCFFFNLTFLMTMIFNLGFIGLTLYFIFVLEFNSELKIRSDYQKMIDDNILMIHRLQRNIVKQHDEVEYLKTRNHGIINTLKEIKKVDDNLLSYLSKQKNKLKHKDLYNFSYRIKNILSKYIEIKSFENYKTFVIDYDIMLNVRNSKLFITKGGKTFAMHLPETFLIISDFLMKVLIQDIKNGKKRERGFVDKDKLEEYVFNGITGANRLNSNISRMRKELKRLGLNPYLIEMKNQKIRINTISENIKIFYE